MADGGEERFSNESPEHLDNLLFAEDLVNYVMLRNSNYSVERDPVPFRELVNSHFDRTIQRVIRTIGRVMEPKITVAFIHRQDSPNFSLDEYARHINTLEIKVFDKYFDPRFFLIYCAVVSKMAALYYNFGGVTAPKTAKSQIVKVLQNRMPAGGWNTVHIAAELYGDVPERN